MCVWERASERCWTKDSIQRENSLCAGIAGTATGMQRIQVTLMAVVINGSSLSAKNSLALSGEWQNSSKGGSASSSILKGPPLNPPSQPIYSRRLQKKTAVWRIIQLDLKYSTDVGGDLLWAISFAIVPWFPSWFSCARLASCFFADSSRSVAKWKKDENVIQKGSPHQRDALITLQSIRPGKHGCNTDTHCKRNVWHKRSLR